MCGTTVITCALDTEKMTLSEFVESVLKAKLGFNTPSVSLSSGAGSTAVQCAVHTLSAL